METITYKLPCGCKFEIEVSYDWVDEKSDVEDMAILNLCDWHRENGGEYDERGTD